MDEGNFKVGRFVCEKKNRFLCVVNIDGADTECYIPSSCRLDNFVKLAGKEVLLKQNLSLNARTKYAVFAVKYKRNYLMLRTSEANDVIWNAIKKRRFAFLGQRKKIKREIDIEGYKADIYIEDLKTLIEIKSIITTGDSAVFPTVYSDRAIEQLKKIEGLLKEGYKVTYVFVSLNPYIHEIRISDQEKQERFTKLFHMCVREGMSYRGYAAGLQNSVPKIIKEVPVEMKE